MNQISIILVLFFLIGGVFMYINARKKSKEEKHKDFVKYYVYLIVVIPILGSIVYSNLVYKIITILIILVGFYELINVSYRTRKQINIIAIIIYSIISILFFKFTYVDKNIQLFTYILVIVFDGFSQLIGQMFGKKKIAPKISPKKTYFGLFGGILFSFLVGLLIHYKLNISFNNVLFFTSIISIFSFLGDLIASKYKRLYLVKDYSKLIPMHGGFLDRFDAYITTCAFMYLFITL